MKKITVLLISVIVLASACGSEQTTESSSQSDESSSQSEINSSFTEIEDDQIFDTEVTDISTGESAPLRTFLTGDKPILVWSWASWCPNCKAEAPGIDQFAAENPDVIVIGIGSAAELETAPGFIEETGVSTSEMVWVESTSLWSSLGFTGRTENLVISSDLTKRSEPTSGFDQTKTEMLLKNL